MQGLWILSLRSLSLLYPYVKWAFKALYTLAVKITNTFKRGKSNRKKF